MWIVVLALLYQEMWAVSAMGINLGDWGIDRTACAPDKRQDHKKPEHQVKRIHDIRCFAFHRRLLSSR
jgi:hypothetical protein